jgi:hypothetical protein
MKEINDEDYVGYEEEEFDEWYEIPHKTKDKTLYDAKDAKRNMKIKKQAELRRIRKTKRA